MINIIREDSLINPDLTSFPASNANVAIFGTQSSGKSTLLNAVFGTDFPILDTTITRQRCTKGIWMQTSSGFNIIDTQGFDSIQRGPQYKMFEKQVALFCLSLSDVLIINIWMNEIGRYEASHSHILKAIIRASQRVIAAQQRKIIVVVRDCTEDADRNILKNELNTHMMGIIKAQSQKSTLKFTLDYFMMSHYEDQQSQFKKQAKELLKLISTTKKSNLNNYDDQDRLVYVRQLWQKVTSSQSEIDLRTVEDALRNYALERIKRETTFHMQEWLQNVENLQKYKTYARFKQACNKQAKLYFLSLKPKHLKQKDVQSYIDSIYLNFDSKMNKYFMTVLLPQQEDRLVQFQYERKLDAMQDTDVSEFKKNMEKRKKELEDSYRNIVKGLRDYAKMTRRFIDKIETKNIKYDQFLEHLQNVFKIQLETALNTEVDKQTNDLQFDQNKLNAVISNIQEKHKSFANEYLPAIWERIIQRTSSSTIVTRIKGEGEMFSTASLGVMLGNQTEFIVLHYRSLQKKAQIYLTKMLNFKADEEVTPNLQKFEEIRRLITNLIDSKLIEEAKRFKITLIFVAILMYLFYSQFKYCLTFLGISKKRMRRWVWLYVSLMVSSFGVLAYRNRDYFKKFIQPQ